MKKVLLPFLFSLLMISSIFGQVRGMHFVKTNGIYYYASHRATAYEITHSHVVDSGTYYYSYDIALVRHIEEGILTDPTTSWLGDSIFVDQAGNTTFYNHYGKALYFKSFSNLETWVVYSEENGAYMEASYISFGDTTTFGKVDFVATLELSVYDSLGNIWESHSYHGFEWEISAWFGIKKQFSVNDFMGIYNDDYERTLATSYQLFGVDTNDDKLGFNYNYRNLVSRLDIGTETHITYGDYYYNYEEKRKIINKVIDDSLCTYTYQSCIRQYDYNLDTIYSQEYDLSYDYNMKLNEIMISPDSNGWNGFFYIGSMSDDPGQIDNRPYFTYTLYNRFGDDDYYGKSWWRIRPDYSYSMGTFAYHLFIDGLGDFMPYRGESAEDEELVYYKTAIDEWGTALEFNCTDTTGISNLSNINISIYPNPTNDFINISNASLQKISSIHIYDLRGKLLIVQEVNELESKTSIGVTALRSGLYFVEVMMEDGRRFQEKIVKE